MMETLVCASSAIRCSNLRSMLRMRLCPTRSPAAFSFCQIFIFFQSILRRD